VFPLEGFEATLRRFVDILEACEIGFHLTGGVSSIAYGEPRLTQDIDIVIDNARASERCDEFVRLMMEADFLFEESEVHRALATRGMFQVLDMSESLKLDVYPRELIPGELSRSEKRELFEGVSLPIVALPDAAVSKLIWISKGSHKNRRDVRRIFARASHPQQEAIVQLAAQLGLSKLLQEVLRETDEIE